MVRDDERRWSRPHAANGSRLFAALLFTFTSGLLAAAEPGEDRRVPLLRAVRLEGVLVVDGLLDEADWERAPSTGPLTQRYPAEGQPATQGSDIRVLYDDERMIIGARLHDDEPARLVAMEMKEDGPLYRDDSFAVFLDTFSDRRNGYFFETNPLGARTDALIFDEGRNNSFDWDGVWQVATRVTDSGWSLEMEIPFQTLHFHPGEVSPWGIQFRRLIRRNAEDVWWSPIPRNESEWRISRAGDLEGLSGIRQGGRWEIKPYALGQAHERPTLGEDDPGLMSDAGVDARFAVTPNLSAVFTVNTDFAETEVDSQQVNTTRFPLFFPEKREFFLESKGYFDFGYTIEGPGGPDVVPFFSRRIGLGDFDIAGETITGPVPILGGAKLAGRLGRYNIGLLTAVTDDEREIPREEFGVLRVSRDILTRSNWGLLAVATNPSGPDEAPDPNDIAAGSHSNQAWGADLNFSVFENFKYGGSFLLTETPGARASQRMGQAYADWSSSAWQLSLHHSDIGEDFNPEAGFVRRRGIEKTDGRAGWSWRSTTAPIRRVEPHARMIYTSDQDHDLATRFQHYGVWFELRDGSSFEAAWNPQFDELDETFELSNEATVPPGAYHMKEVFLEWEGDPSRIVSGEAMLQSGDFFDGDRFEANGTLTTRLSRYLRSSLTVSRVEIDLPRRTASAPTGALPASEFNTTLVQANVGVTFTTRLFADALLQYNTDVDDFSSNLRLNYKYRPGSDIYIVYNERRDIEGLPTDTVDRSLTVKWTYLFSL